MKYKPGDKVRIKSLEWYKANKDKYGAVYCGGIPFVKGMSKYCGKVLTIERIFDFNTPTYEMIEDQDHYDWNDEMIEDPVDVKPQDKMVSLDSVCEYLYNNWKGEDYYASDIIEGLRKTMEGKL